MSGDAGRARPTTVISDFGGVLTSPLLHSFAAFQDRSGIRLEALGAALGTLERETGLHPLYELECGRMTEERFLRDLGDQLAKDLGHAVEMHEFTEQYFAHLRPNEPMIACLRQLRDGGVRMAMLTNNVREWEPRWRAMLPVDEIFEDVVDSAFVGMRKPDPRIYLLSCERLGVQPAECVFLDDLEVNCTAAAELGMTAVWFRDNDQAIAEVRAALGR
jgi:putative hydrolase of the HAD superfamily